MKGSWRTLFSALLLVVPRTTLAYGAYLLAPILLYRWRLRPTQVLFFVFILGYAAASLLIQSEAHVVSVTSALIELALLTPMLFFAADLRIIGTSQTIPRFLRTANVVVAAASIIKIPFSGIPYVTVPPDYWNGLFGLGGAKIVTVIGFFGLLQELLLHKHRRAAPKIFVIIALANFVIPSYLIGVAAGIVALIFAYSRSLKVLIPILIVALPITWFVAEGRIGQLNQTASQVTGASPKVYAYTSSLKMVSDGNLLGVGPGQFSSTPQTWVDPGLQAVSTHSIPDIPGLFMSDQHRLWLTPYTGIGVSDPAAMASAANQPVTGWSALLGEWGFASIMIMIFAVRRYRNASRKSAIAAAGVFALVLNTVDLWIDNPWLWACLAVVHGLSGELRTEDQVNLSTVPAQHPTHVETGIALPSAASQKTG